MLQKICTTHQGVTIKLEFDEEVYQPGPLTKALADRMQVRPGDRVVDVGCGTGYLGLVAALLHAAEVICIDPVTAAVRWARHNARLNDLKNIFVRQGYELEPLDGEHADLVLTLPPQMPFHTDFNPWRYGGPDGCDVLLRIVRQAQAVLAPRQGRMYLVHSALANPSRVRKTLERSCRQWEVVHTLKKEWSPSETKQLHPDLFSYLLKLEQEGKAELERCDNQIIYPVWFYLVHF